MNIFRRLFDWLTLRDYDKALREWQACFYIDEEGLVAASEGATKAMKYFAKARRKAQKKGLLPYGED